MVRHVDNPICEGGNQVQARKVMNPSAEKGHPYERLEPFVAHFHGGNKPWVMYRRDTPEPIKQAAAMNEFFSWLNVNYRAIFRLQVCSFEDLRQATAVVEKLKNPFTGKYAVPVNFPSPGDFRVITRLDSEAFRQK